MPPQSQGAFEGINSPPTRWDPAGLDEPTGEAPGPGPLVAGPPGGMGFGGTPRPPGGLAPLVAGAPIGPVGGLGLDPRMRMGPKLSGAIPQVMFDIFSGALPLGSTVRFPVMEPCEMPGPAPSPRALPGGFGASGFPPPPGFR